MFEVVELIETEVIAFRDGVGVLEIDDGVGGGANGVAWFAKTKKQNYIFGYIISGNFNFTNFFCVLLLVKNNYINVVPFQKKNYSQIILFFKN